MKKLKQITLLIKPESTTPLVNFCESVDANYDGYLVRIQNIFFDGSSLYDSDNKKIYVSTDVKIAYEINQVAYYDGILLTSKNIFKFADVSSKVEDKQNANLNVNPVINKVIDKVVNNVGKQASDTFQTINNVCVDINGYCSNINITKNNNPDIEVFVNGIKTTNGIKYSKDKVSIKISNNNTEIRIPDVKYKNASVKAYNGNLNAYIRANNVSIHTSSGNVTANVEAEHLDIDSSYGNCEVSGKGFKNIKLKSSCGNIKINTALDNDLMVDIKESNGNAEFNLKNVKEIINNVKTSLCENSIYLKGQQNITRDGHDVILQGNVLEEVKVNLQ